MKRYFVLLLFGLWFFFGFFPNQSVLAQTAQDLQSNIKQLQQQIDALQAQNTPTPSLFSSLPRVIAGIPDNFSFSRRLVLGSKGEDVRYLQKVLNNSSDTRIAKSGNGSPGKETDLFGAATQKALIKFQEKYAQDILAPSGLKKGTGVVGAATNIRLNSLLVGDAFEDSKIAISSLRPQQANTIVAIISQIQQGETITASFAGQRVDFFPAHAQGKYKVGS